MFGIFRLNGSRPTIRLVGYVNGEAQFRCDKRLNGKPHDIVAQLPDGQKLVGTVSEVEGPSNGVYSGKLGPRPVAAAVAQFFAEKEHQLYYKIDSGPTRHVRRFLIRCPDFPGFKGITKGLSMAEADLVLEGPMNVGQRITVTLQLDDQQQSTLTLDAEVTSSTQPTPRSTTCDVGIRWVGLSGPQASMLEAYLRELKRRTSPA